MTPSISSTAPMRQRDLRTVYDDRSGEIQLNGEGSPFTFFAFECDLAVVVENDILCVGQAQPGSFRFTGEIGFEDPRLRFVRHAGTIVRNKDNAFSLPGRRGDL